MKNCLTVIFLPLCLFISEFSFGQHYGKRRTNTFAASAIIGTNFSQMNGDASSGFDKVGIMGGLRGSILFTERHQLNIELIYSQKGSKLERQGYVFAGGQNELIKVDYIDIPIMFQVYPKKNNGKTYAEAGVYFGRNIRTKIEENVRDTSEYFAYAEIAPEFKSFEFGGVLGFGLKFLKHFGLGARFSLALTPLFHDEDFNIPDNKLEPVEPVFKLQSYFLTAYAAYHF